MTTSLTSLPWPRQSRVSSLAEALANVIAGFVLAIMVQLGAYPLLGITTTIAQNSIIALLFTAVSLLRSYLIRRLFVGIEAARERDAQDRARRLERRLSSGRL